MRKWLPRQINRVQKFLGILPFIINESGSRFAAFQRISVEFLFRGIAGLKVLCRPYLLEIENLRRIETLTPKAADWNEQFRQHIFKAFTRLDKVERTKIILELASGHFPGLCGLSSKRGYIIMPGADWVPNSAGIKCLYNLCHELNLRGYPSFMACATVTSPDLIAPIINDTLVGHLIKLGFTVVYPETILGNPLSAKNTVRWVLNQPGLLGGAKVYKKDELVFFYTDTFRPYIKNNVAGKLYMPTIDEQIFFDDGRDPKLRGLECYYVGKSKYREGYFDSARAFEITRDSPLKKDLGSLFRNSKVLYCFDNSTILTYEAILCGCPCVIIPDGSRRKSDLECSELGMDGISWGLTDLDVARANMGGLKIRYAKIKEEFRQQLDDFIAITQNKTAPRGHEASPDRFAHKPRVQSTESTTPVGVEVVL